MSEPASSGQPSAALPAWLRRAPALAFPDYRRLLVMRTSNTLAIAGQSIAVGWQIYDISNNAYYLGLIGLVQFAPSLLLALMTGVVADRYDRRIIAAIGFAIMAASSFGLMVVSIFDIRAVWPFFVLVGLVGIARAFLLPTVQALTPNVVPFECVPNAVALNAVAARLGAALGPLSGGLLYGVHPAIAYAVFAAMLVVGFVQPLRMQVTRQIVAVGGVGFRTLLAGLSHIRRTRLLLGAISFDFFSGLMAGVNALLPVFARDILHTSPAGLGVLRASIAVGATLVAVLLGVYSVKNHVGLFMFGTIAIYGAASVSFGLSETMWLSVAALFVMGAADVCSSYFRWNLVQLWTPDDVRGRVAAVTSISATGSTETGNFRAGMMAGMFGPVPAVVIGGVLAIAGCVVWARMFPEMLRLKTLDGPKGGDRVRST